MQVPPAPPRPPAAQALPRSCLPGDVIAGKYAIVRVLGEGGMGVVFEATHLKLRQRVALKMLLPDMLSHEIIVTRFEREARAAGQLRNRHAARVMDVDVTVDGLPYMVMEFLQGHDLQTELEQRGRLPCEEAVDYVLQACSAMIEAHQLGIVHRDLKPANLFLAHDGDPHETRDSRIVKVLDFGISKVQNEGDASLTTAESVMGTALYMSPEQVRSSGTVDARTDIWSLGIILYELLAGHPPWMGTPTQLAAAIVSEDAPDIRTFCEIPAEMVAIVMKALQRNPQNRYADVKALALALAPFAPASGAGRMLAEGLMNSSSGSFQRVSIRPRMEEARTIVQAAAVSGDRIRGEGTAPGWTQHDQPAARHRTVIIGFAAAFAAGLLVIGLIAFAWMRVRSSPDRSAAQAGSNMPSASGASGAGDPLPPAIDPAPPTTGQGAPEIGSARPGQPARPRPAAPGVRPGGAAKPVPSGAPPKPGRTTAPLEPKPAASGNPLLL